jgi:ABC-type nitrate/sulfonate/bicarbonate transport system substrate-binding protein
MRFNSGPACSEALFSGSAQVATMGDATAVIAVARNPSLRIVASHAAGEHRHRLVGGKGLAYNGPRDLRGKTLAVKKGTSTYGGLLAFLAAHGIAPDELRIINLRPSEMPEALMAGSIDCFVASEPTPSLAETRGAAPLETLGGLDNNYPIMIVAHEQVVAARPNDLRALLRALHRAVKFMREQPDRALTIVSEATGLPPAAAASAMQRHSYGVNLDAVTMGSLGRTAAFLADQRVVPAAPDLAAASTPDLLPQEAPHRKQNTAQSLGGDR